jgi:cysteine-rich repeat protein
VLAVGLRIGDRFGVGRWRSLLRRAPSLVTWVTTASLVWSAAIAPGACSTTATPTSCNDDSACDASAACMGGICTPVDTSDPGQGEEGEGEAGEGEGEAGEGEGEVGEGEGEVGEGEGEAGEGEGEGEGEELPRCGNGAREQEEQCDDGNDVNGDGCESDCTSSCVVAEGVSGERALAGGRCAVSLAYQGSWREGLAACRRLGGELARLDDAGVVSAVAPLALPSGAWIGLSDVFELGNFRWVDETLPAVGFFAAGQPRPDQGHQCTLLRGDGQWEATTCDTALPALCVVEPTVACGNELLDADEQCDDGNRVDGDGCDSACALEPGAQCSGTFCRQADTPVILVPDMEPGIDAALAALPRDGGTILVRAPGDPEWDEEIDGDVDIIGIEPGVVLERSSPVSVFAARLRVFAVSLRVRSASTTTSPDCFEIEEAGSLELVDVEVGSCDGYGVLARQNSSVALRRSRIHDAQRGGVRLETDRFVLENLIVDHNGEAGSQPGLEFKTAPLPTSRARHLTVAFNRVRAQLVGGIDCVGPVDIHASIVWGNEGAQVGSACRLFDSDVEGGVVGGIGNLALNPVFVDGAAGDLHVSNGSPCIDAAPLSSMRLDVDGVIRSGVRDIGADEH